MEDAKSRGKDDAIKEVLPVFDNLERAVVAAESAQTIASVVEGGKMVLKLFEDTAERMGLKRVVTVGERFDPAVHEAIQQQETDAHPPGTILTEVVPGYMFGTRHLRAAMVTVARKPVVKQPAADAAHGDNGVDSSAAKGGGNTA
jgi:molecular chaperone GrpE